MPATYCGTSMHLVVCASALVEEVQKGNILVEHAYELRQASKLPKIHKVNAMVPVPEAWVRSATGNCWTG
jgi:hypothetical protein